MKVSVVVTTYNRRPLLERCLSSLAAQTLPASEYEIVVVADGCTDDTEDLLGSFRPPCIFRWFSQLNQGQPAAQNLGVANSRGDVVLFMDDDCICDSELVAAHLEAHTKRSQIVVIGAILLHPESPSGTLQEMVRELEDREFRRLNSEGTRQSDLMLCANSSIDRGAALDCKFDMSFERMHDVEAGIRLWEKGYRPQFAANAIAYEHYTKTEKAMLRDSYYQGKYEVLLTRRHPAFKPLTSIVNLNEGNLLKRALRKQLCLHPWISQRLLQTIGDLAGSLRAIPLFWWLAKRALGARAGVSHLNGAIKEAGSWDALEEQFGKRVPVLMYHNVGSPRASEFPGLTTRTVEFEAQIGFLARMGYVGIVPSDWLRWRDEGGMLPRRPVMLVFDDAYADACLNAFPILERYRFGAACMLVTQYIGSTNRWDEDMGRPSFQLMDECQIRDWSKRGIEFGGHSRSHPELPFISVQQAEEEIERCKNDLTGLLGEPPRCFAYPFGGVNSEVQAVVSKHFALAFTAWQGVLHLGTNLHLVPRVFFLPGETRFGIWCRLRLGRNLFEVCRGRWRRLTQKIRKEPVVESSSPGEFKSERPN